MFKALCLCVAFAISPLLHIQGVSAATVTFKLNGGFVFTSPAGNGSYLSHNGSNPANLTIDGYDTASPTLRITGSATLLHAGVAPANSFLTQGGGGTYSYDLNLITGLQNVTQVNPNFTFDWAFGSAAGKTAANFPAVFADPNNNINSALFTAPNGLTLSLGGAGATEHGFSIAAFISGAPGSRTVELHGWYYIPNGGTYLALNPNAITQHLGGDFHFRGNEGPNEPVPEPSTLLLLGLGALPFLRRTRRS